MSSTRATDIHFKNNSNESSRFLLDNEHQDLVNVTPDTVLEGSIYRSMFNYLGPIPYKILLLLLLLFFFLSRLGLILSLVPCRWSTCDIAAGTACDTSPKYEDITPPATRNIACLRSSVQVNFRSIPAVKPDMASVTSDLGSHFRTVSQVARRHIRTRPPQFNHCLKCEPAIFSPDNQTKLGLDWIIFICKGCFVRIWWAIMV